MIRALAATLALLLGAATIVRADDLAASTPEHAYVAAVAEMRALAIPAVVAYHSIWMTQGGGIRIVQDGPRVVLEGGVGRGFPSHAEYDVRFDTAGRTIDVTTPSVHLRGSGSRLFDPTWHGAYDILRYGLHERPPAPPSPVPAPSADASGPAATEQTIASVVTISPAYYRVTDRGSGVCPNGDDGRVLGLHALGDARSHPLTEVTIDANNGRFCTMRFNLDESGAVGVTGAYTIDFAQAGAYWLVSGGITDISVRVLGIAAKHVVLRWTYGAFTTGT